MNLNQIFNYYFILPYYYNMAELDEKINNYSENKKRHSFLEEYEELEMYKIVQEKRFSIYKDNTPDISNAIITIYPEYILKVVILNFVLKN